MSRSTPLCLAIAASLLVLLSTTARAADLEDQIKAHLAAGEFAPALRLAEGIDDAATRDEQFGNIAVAQNQAGARRGAENVIGRIGDDRARAHAIDHVLAQRFGNNPGVDLGGFGLGDQGAAGGAAGADFEAIIELITSTIEPESWEEVGGPGAIAEFEGGVVVDVSGVMRRVVVAERGGALRELRRVSDQSDGNEEIRRASKLRKVSLTRLEKQIQLRSASATGATEAMRNMAGLQRIQYVLVYPETGDLVIAGPAGDWKQDDTGRSISVENGRPVLQLDDLVAVLRHMTKTDNARFGCSITPRQESLARIKNYIAETSKQPLKPGRAARERWVAGLRDAVGLQDIEVYGIDQRTRVARVLVEADYHMKLIGMGLEEGVAGVTSYLDSLQLKKGEAPPPMSVLRWWFTLNYDAVTTSKDRNAFELKGQGVQVLSENEMLTKQGKRVHTGKSEELNRRFAASFTREFPALAGKYPIYAELQNVFDLAMVAALCTTEDLPSKVGWHMAWFGDDQRYHVLLGPNPQQVESIVNSRSNEHGQIVAGVSGGVRVDPASLVQADKIKKVGYGDLTIAREQTAPEKVNPERWWWD